MHNAVKFAPPCSARKTMKSLPRRLASLKEGTSAESEEDV